MTSIGLWLKLAALAAVAGVAFLCGHDIGKKEGIIEGRQAGIAETTAHYAGVMEQQNRQAAADLKAAVDHNAALKADYAALAEAQEKDHVAAQAKLAALTAANRGLLNANKQLRDPYAHVTACRDSGQGATATAATGPPGAQGGDGAANGVLSAELSGFLLQQTKLADERNTIANECIAYRDAVEKPGVDP